MTKKRFGHQEIKDYILGKLSAEQASELQKALELDPALKKVYKSYIAKKDLLQHYETMQFTAEQNDAGYKRVLNSRKKPVWAPGQVWEIEDLGRMIILSVNDLFQCRGMLLSKSTQFAGEGDILFQDANIAAAELCAFTNHLFTINPEHLTLYSGQLPPDALKIFRKAAAGQKVLLPKGYSRGEETNDSEAEIWHEYISEVLNEFTAEALEAYENASELSKEILELIAPDQVRYQLFLDEEPADVRYSILREANYSLAASAGPPQLPKKTLLYKDSEIKLEASFNKRRPGVTLIITLKEDAAELKILSLRHEGSAFLTASSVQVSSKIARHMITEPEALARLAVLPVELIIETGSKTYTIQLDIRKTP
ncbi:MAG: hypothetical protein FMNOHCHN_00541 [Ignavibacteriaceae bacterium]|nr:hypothetical protein [Ignavibacteriaceae bacterium]